MLAARAPSRLASRRAITRPGRPRRRLGRLLADGLTPTQAARVAGVDETEVAGLLAEPGFGRLVEAYRAFDALPEAARRERLVKLARCLIEDAITDGDVRVALFVLREEGRGRDPARTVAEGAIAAHRRAAAARPARPSTSRPSLTPPAPPTRVPRPLPELADRDVWRTAARLRDALAAEHAARHRAVATATETPVAASVVAERQPNRHERRRKATLARQRPTCRASGTLATARLSEHSAGEATPPRPEPRPRRCRPAHEREGPPAPSAGGPPLRP